VSEDRAVRLWGNFSAFILLLAPFLAFWAFFWLFPLIGGLELVMELSPSVVATDRSSMAEFDNLLRALEDSKFRHSLENTAWFVCGTLLVTLTLGFFLAASIFRMKRRYQAISLFLLLIPCLAMPSTLASLFYLFFHGKSGALNQFLVIPLGFDPVNWMMSPSWILPCLVAQAVWRWTGLLTLLLYCGMRAIPRWQFEVAQIEGATFLAITRTILYPGVRHLLLFGGVFLFVDGVASFSGAYSLLGGSGGVMDAGLLFVTYAYQVAFPGGVGRFDLPLASAMCILVASGSAICGFFILRLRNI
jgi:multiple sugar transport system permease protein